MITKRNLWFLTLFSLILVMSIYYVTYPEDNSLVLNELTSKEDVEVSISESDFISTLKVEDTINTQKNIEDLNNIINDINSTMEEKSDAYDALKHLKSIKGKEDELEKGIKKNFNYDSYIKIDGDLIKVTIDSSEHSYDLANKIMDFIQKQFNEKKYITISFN